MAIYTYKCNSCDITKDIVRGMMEAEQAYKCESCSSQLVRIFQAPGVQFNGSGFYSTDK